MDLIELAQLVKATRAAQKSYFLVRNKQVLAQAKALEVKLDVEVNTILGQAAYEAGGQEWADWNESMLDFGE